MRLLLAFLIALTFTLPVMAADLDSGQVSELYEHPRGRSVIFDQSELITIWYTGSSANSGFGVSGTVATKGLEIVFYEGGVTNTALRFNGSAYAVVGISGKVAGTLTGNTVQNLVDSINTDSQGEFVAAVGRDATPGTTTSHMLPTDVILGIPNRENEALVNAVYGLRSINSTVKEDTSSSDQILAGFRANSRTVNRMKQLTETFEGAGTHNIRVWDGTEVVWRQSYGNQASYAGFGTPGAVGYRASVTPLTIGFTDHGAKGLCSVQGNNITVESTWGTSAVGTTEANTNLSIIVGEWKN